MPDRQLKTERTTVKRTPNRGIYDRAAVHAILDASLICHVGIVVDAQPFVIPTMHARVGDNLYLHGATKSRLVQVASAGGALSVSCTLVDGLVLARCAFNHSLNYRSAVLLGAGALVDDDTETREVYEAFVDRVYAGRWRQCRQPNESERKATSLVRIPIVEASAKVRAGGPKDSAEDRRLDHWAGWIPMHQTLGAPIPAPELPSHVQMPAALALLAGHASTPS